MTTLDVDYNDAPCVDLLGDVAVLGNYRGGIIKVWNIKSGSCNTLDSGYDGTWALKLYDSFLLSGHDGGAIQ